MFDQKTIDRFWSKVDKTSNPNGCWEWIGHKNKHFGYGRFGFNNKRILVHRFSYLLHFGKITTDLKVLHKCDNSLCVNPSHLFLGTQLDNIKDRETKNRTAKGKNCGVYTHPESRATGRRNGRYTQPDKTARGEQHGKSKITKEQVLFIRKINPKTTIEMKLFARKYNITYYTIYDIVHRRTWKHI